MSFTVRPVRADELDSAFEVIEEGRRAIAALGIDQWQNGNPSRENIIKDIENRRLYGAYDEAGLCAVCALCGGIEPYYNQIDGEWLTNGPYITIHRMAARLRARHSGAAIALVNEAERIARASGIPSLRADTHRGNAVMQRFMDKNGFVNCGITDYTPQITGCDPIRIVYEKRLE